MTVIAGKSTKFTERKQDIMIGIYPLPRWRIYVTGYDSPKTTPKPPIRKPRLKSDFNPPKHEIDSFARCILPAIQAYFESEEGKKEYAEWCAKRQAENDKTA